MIVNSNSIEHETILKNYTKICQNKNLSTLIPIIDCLKHNDDPHRIARENLVSSKSLNTISRTYDMIGGDNMTSIATNFCMNGGTDEESIKQINELIDTTNKLLPVVQKVAEGAIKTGMAIVGLYNAFKKPDQPTLIVPSSSSSSTSVNSTSSTVNDIIKEDLGDSVTVNPKTKDDVLINIKYLQEQLEAKTKLIEALTQNVNDYKQTIDQLRSTSTSTSTATTPIMTNNCDDDSYDRLKEQNTKLQEDLRLTQEHDKKILESYVQQHNTTIRKLDTDITLKKDKECNTEIRKHLKHIIDLLNSYDPAK